LEESGERERLRELLRQRLKESGWQNQVQLKCQEIIKERGVENITAEELVTEVTPQARKLVPDEVKKDLLHNIRSFLQQHSGISDL